jgi:putative ATP-dependent endonuclease of the OLD family
MKIKKLEIKNYRNLDGLTIHFEDNCNFIVGENNLGKSNILWLLNTIFSYRSFKAEDFKKQDIPIEIDIQLKLDDMELGVFQDLFDTVNHNLINIVVKQENTDENIVFLHKETSTAIPASSVRCINFIHYDSLRNPIAEINFDKGKGVGKFLSLIVAQYIETNKISNSSFIDKKLIDDLLNAINNKTSKIKFFKDHNIAASPEDNIETLLLRLITLKDANGENLTKAGYGIQFLILVTLSILEQIQFITQQRKDRAVFENPANKERAISLVLGLDEPEIHLHPYMQRSLIKYLNGIIGNNNKDFMELVKEMFDIDKFIGQIVVVTHSPNILLDNYKEIIRLFSEKSILKTMSGSELMLDRQIERHIYLHFPFIKEAFFSRCAIFVEGDTEYACLPILGEKIYTDFDDLGIGVIQAGGESVPQLIQIANSFGIPSVGITDQDDGRNPPKLPNHYQTSLRDFEEEIISLMIDRNKESVLRKIVVDYDPKGEERVMQTNALNSRALRYKVFESEYKADLKLVDIHPNDLPNLKSFYLAWFSVNKSYPLGKLIGETLSKDDTPLVYRKIIDEAYKMAKNV